jgi:hypothetical protein
MGCSAALKPDTSVYQAYLARSFAAAARQIASKLRSYAFGRSGMALS